MAAPNRMTLTAIAEMALATPAVLLLTAAALRTIGGRGLPARAAADIMTSVEPYLTLVSAALLFIALPLAALIMGSVAVVRAWHQDALLRQEALAVIALLRRRLAVVLVAVATLVGGLIVVAAVAHVITD